MTTLKVGVYLIILHWNPTCCLHLWSPKPGANWPSVAHGCHLGCLCPYEPFPCEEREMTTRKRAFASVIPEVRHVLSTWGHFTVANSGPDNSWQFWWGQTQQSFGVGRDLAAWTSDISGSIYGKVTDFAVRFWASLYSHKKSMQWSNSKKNSLLYCCCCCYSSSIFICQYADILQEAAYYFSLL